MKARELSEALRDALASDEPHIAVAHRFKMFRASVVHLRRRLFPGRSWPITRAPPTRDPDAASHLLAEIRAFNERWQACVEASRALRLQTSASWGG